MEQHDKLRMPDLALNAPLILTHWHATKGGPVLEGDRLLEICAGEVTIDLPAPATGVLVRRCVREDDEVVVGQTLAWIAKSE